MSDIFNCLEDRAKFVHSSNRRHKMLAIQGCRMGTNTCCRILFLQRLTIASGKKRRHYVWTTTLISCVLGVPIGVGLGATSGARLAVA
jgi:hypothetical protein